MSNVIFQETANHDSLKVIDSPYRRYSCQEGNPLGCSFLKATAQTDPQVQICPVCTFPTPLPDNAEIQGENGIYRLDTWLGKRGLGRLYLATLLGLNQKVVIKEYLLPQLHFSAAEIRERQQTFVQVSGLSLADGRVQDFRVSTILEAIPDVKASRCYLILETTAANPTLRQYLQQGAFSENAVYRVLQQVLQSLKFLHSQCFRLPSGQMATGLVHGNLSLDSLLISVQPMDLEIPFVTQAQRLTPDHDFFLYLCDLTLWEVLFLPSLMQTQIHSPTDDLVALGTVAFDLLTADSAKETGTPLDPVISQHWPTVDPKLKRFILRLLRLEQPFESADTALQELYRSPLSAAQTSPILLESELTPTRKKRVRLRWVLLLSSLFLLGLLGWLASFLLSSHRQSSSTPKPLLCCLKEVTGLLPGTFTYAATQNGIWQYVLQQKNLIRPGVSFEQQLQQIFPQLHLKLQPTASTAQAIANVRSGSAEFAIAPLLQPLPEDLESQVIAYDGVAIVVAFSYAKRQQSLPIQLGGQITLAQLQTIYTTQPESWQALQGSPLPMRQYFPNNAEVLEVFKTRVTNEGSRSQSLPELDLMRTVLRDFELRNIGAIGFAPLSKVVGQCSVYPLALKWQGQAEVQALQFKNGQPISPATDLCSKKGAYALNPQVLQTGRYPLAYPIAVIYPRDNDRLQIGEKIAELFKTTEGQDLLTEAGLVPFGL
jgi:serine/threonine protein kinase